MTRHYNAKAPDNPLRPFGANWTASYFQSIKVFTVADYSLATVYRPDGKFYTFQRYQGQWIAEGFVIGKLERLEPGGVFTGWRYTTGVDDLVETYNAQGRLISIANRAGLTQTLTYDGTSRLSTVSDPFGRALTFGYDAQNRVASMTDAAGAQYIYTYDTNNDLVSVAYPASGTRIYHYNESQFIQDGFSLPNAMTGITDENNQRYANFEYATNRIATATEHAGGVNRYSIQYDVGGPNDQVTDPLGCVRDYRRAVPAPQGRLRMGTIFGLGDCSTDNSTYSYDPNTAMLSSMTNSLGITYNYLYEPRGLETARTEAVGTPAERTIATTYHPTFRLPTLITEPGRTSAMTYDAAGNLLTRTITDTALSRSRTWTYTYNANGQVLTVDGPRTDVSDVTTYTYYANNDADLGKRGNIATIANALGHVTSITAYNAHGQPLTIVDPNGLTTTLTYDARQRLTSRTVGGELTSYTYDGVGQLTKVTLPDGSFLNYTYDAAHRLTQIADSLGNRIVYTLDAMGNRTQEQVFDPSNALAQTRSRVYNSLNRLTQEIGAQGQSTTYGYDNQGNVTSIDGPLPGAVDVTTNSYDALNRLTRMTDPNAGQVNYAYNALDQMTSVQDPRSLTTSYAYDALNNLNQLASPDTGATQNTYDAAGNLLTQLDAKGQSTSYTYDTLNRVTGIAYTTDPGLNVTFTYDQGATGKGRLTGVTDSTGTLSYAYDIRGRLISETRIIGGVIYATGYSYDSAGRLAGMTYPGGRQLSYTRDALGRVSGITTTRNNLTQALLTGVAYRPFGPEQSYTFGNNQTYTRGFDQDGRIAAYTLPNQTLAVGYDSASRITAITDTGVPSNVLTYNYDALDRVTGFNAPALSLNQAFGYDAVGNRTSQTLGANNYTSTYAAASNRIASTTGPTPKSFSFDANGSITNDTVNQYTFDARGRLQQATTTAGVSQFLVNTLGQRVKKSAAGIETVFHYDASGRLISETDAQGNVRQEYVYLNDIPLAVLK